MDGTGKYFGMRDINRIPTILNAIVGLWKNNPDLRLGQLLVNAIRAREPCPEISYREDDDILKGFEKLEENKRSSG